MSNSPTWALFAPVSTARLKKYLGREGGSESLRIRSGSGQYNALLDYEPGTEHSGEREVAASLSKRGPVYIAYFDPPWISTFENGAVTDESAGEPDDLAERLKCPIAEETLLRRPPIDADAEIHALVIVNSTPQQVAEYYEQPWPLPAGTDLSIREGSVGLVVTEPGADLLTTAPILAARLQTKVYAVEIQRSGGAVTSLRCQIFQAGKDMGSFDDPHTWWSEPDTLHDVLGATTAPEIMARLDL